MKIKYGLGALLLIMLLLVGCGEESATSDSNGDAEPSEVEEQENNEELEEEVESEADANSEDDLGDFQVEFSGEIKEEGEKFVIEGMSNLIPGSRLVAELIVSEDEVFADTTELVEDDGSFFSMQLEHHQYGEAEIVIRFDFDSVQEDHVQRHYGERGQNLEGPFIYKHEIFGDIYKKAEAKISYHPQGSSELTIAAPNWNEIPEDYGEPRVWIEVDEITEDGEFFYLQGRSNLLEGAEIRGSFGNNRDTTQIQPDGSFDLKIPYKYIEDEDFEIEFNPQWQWNEIEEAYGSQGQKLIGDLVESNSYSDQQYIVKVIPWDYD